jgi:hypothetical protein
MDKNWGVKAARHPASKTVITQGHLWQPQTIISIASWQEVPLPKQPLLLAGWGLTLPAPTLQVRATGMRTAHTVSAI